MESPITRNVGVEIECIVPHGSEIDTTADAVEDGSIEVQNSEDEQGLEFRTQPSSGKEAEDTITGLCKSLESAGAYVNTTCGLHVHADAPTLSIQKLVRLYQGRRALGNEEKLYYVHRSGLKDMQSSFLPMDIDVLALSLADLLDSSNVEAVPATGKYGEGNLFEIRGRRKAANISPVDGRVVIPSDEESNYLAFAVKTADFVLVRTRLYNAMRFFSIVDPLIRTMIPASRRKNGYCHPFEKMVRSGGKMPRSLTELYEGIGDRYCGINLASLHKHGTIENRYHNATVDADKIIHWARLWARIVDVALSSAVLQETEALSLVVSQKSRLDMLFALLDLPQETERHLRKRIRSFSGSDSSAVKLYISNKKKLVCAA